MHADAISDPPSLNEVVTSQLEVKRKEGKEITHNVRLGLSRKKRSI
jgi:hypothetical protein